jgi:hypothetical protein
MKSLTNWLRKVLPKPSIELSDSPERVESADTVSAILAQAQDRIKKYPGLRVTVIRNTPNSSRPVWLERWGHKIPAHPEVRKFSAEELRAEKETQELIKQALKDRKDAGVGPSD